MTEFLHVNAVNCTLIWTPTILHNNMLKHNGLHWLNNNTIMHLHWMYTRLKKLAILLMNFTACKPTKELFHSLLTLDILTLLYNMYTMFILEPYVCCPTLSLSLLNCTEPSLMTSRTSEGDMLLPLPCSSTRAEKKERTYRQQDPTL